MKSALAISVAGLVCVAAPQCAHAADPSPAQAQATLEGTLITNAAAKQKMELDALAAIKSSYSGGVVPGTGAGIAESITLTQVALRASTAIVAGRIKTAAAGKSILVVYGSDRPNIANWIAFNGIVATLNANFKQAEASWNIVNLPAPALGAPGDAVTSAVRGEDLAAAVPLIAAVTTIASLLKSDWTTNGIAVSTDANQFTTIMYDALRHQSIAFEELNAHIVTDAAPIITQLAPLTVERGVVEADYDAYTRKLVKDYGGKTDKMPDAMVEAGKSLSTVLSDYDALLKNLYAVDDKGNILAVTIQYQARLANIIKASPVLYIKSVHAATSFYTRRNLFTGYTKIPSFASATSEVEYELITPSGDTYPGSVAYTTDYVRVTDVKDYGYTSSSTTNIKIPPRKLAKSQEEYPQTTAK